MNRTNKTNNHNDESKNLLLEIKNKIETSSYEECQDILDNLYNKWIIRPDNTNNLFDYLEIALSNFELDKNSIQMGLFEHIKTTTIYQITSLKSKFDDFDNSVIENRDEYEKKFSRIFRAVIDADSAISSSLFLKSSMTLEDIGNDKVTKHSLFRYSEIDYGKLNPWQTLLIFLIEQLKRKEYRRYIIDNSGFCYAKIYNASGYNTHAWKKLMSIKEFIQSITKKDYNFIMWQNLTIAKDNLDQCVRYLTACPSEEFEDLDKQRNVYSFNNGIYITKKWDEENDKWVDKWIPFEGPGSLIIGDSVVSCKLFELDFEDCSGTEDWYDIIEQKCPKFDKIMIDQDWEKDVRKWMCVFIGRMMYEVGELDNWQVLPYLLGVAGTGKSTILENVVKLLYEPEDVGVLSNNIEKKFGLAPLIGKKIFIGSEIKGNLSLEQAEFQCMISGDTMQIAEKNKPSRTVKFTAPGIAAGNEFPNFTDNAGSMVRRIVTFYLGNKIRKSDTKLAKGIQKEIAYIIQACNRGYLQTIHENGKTGIWEILPDYFKETQGTMEENSNSLVHFLNSGIVTFGNNGKDENGIQLYCLQSVFVAAFNDHCRESHFLCTKWTSQFYSGPFADYNIKIARKCNKRYPNKPGAEVINGIFLMGVDIRDPIVKGEAAKLKE